MEISILYIISSVLLGFLFAEFVGYWLHILLHSNKIRFLSDGHMLHHIRLYGPDFPQRSEEYRDSAISRANILGYGMEWVIPVIALIAVIFSVGWFFDIPFLYQISFASAAFIWAWFLFGYMHVALHLENFWMLRSKLFKNWFLRVRKWHDIHHIHLSDNGKMNKNFGICFFAVDRIFGSLEKDLEPINKNGLKAMKIRYNYIDTLKV